MAEFAIEAVIFAVDSQITLIGSWRMLKIWTDLIEITLHKG